MQNIKNIVSVFVFFYVSIVLAQKTDPFERFRIAEDSLSEIGKQILQAEDYEVKKINSDKLLNAFRILLDDEKSMDYEFALLTNVSKIISDDKKVRLITWMLPLEDGSFHYLGFAQLRKEKKNPYQYVELFDKSAEIKKATTKVLTPEEWWGTLYYTIITSKYKRKNYYTLLGYDANGLTIQKKIIDCLQIGNDRQITFGAPMFISEKKAEHRVFFQYAKDISMSLRFNKKKKMIVFDHLVPQKPSLEGMYEFYGPDFSYDAYQWKKGKWKYVKDIDARNEDANEGNKSKKVERKVFTPK
jgi:hypothetical protein